jgi:hypothetical protein
MRIGPNGILAHAPIRSSRPETHTRFGDYAEHFTNVMDKLGAALR